MGTMHVLFATAEPAPLVAVGGLAKASARLVAEFRRQGVMSMLGPAHYGGSTHGEITGRPSARLVRPGGVRTGVDPAVGAICPSCEPESKRSHPTLNPAARVAGQPWRFLTLLTDRRPLVGRDPPYVLHLNDWHTGTVLVAPTARSPRRAVAAQPGLSGLRPRVVARAIGPRASHFEWYGGTNPLSGANRPR